MPLRKPQPAPDADVDTDADEPNDEPDLGSEEANSLEQFYQANPDATQKWVDTDADFIDWGPEHSAGGPEDDEGNGGDNGNDGPEDPRSAAGGAGGTEDQQPGVDLSQQEIEQAAQEFYQSFASEYGTLLDQHKDALMPSAGQGEQAAEQLEQPPAEMAPPAALEQQQEPAANAQELYRLFRQQLEGKH